MPNRCAAASLRCVTIRKHVEISKYLSSVSTTARQARDSQVFFLAQLIVKPRGSIKRGSASASDITYSFSI